MFVFVIFVKIVAAARCAFGAVRSAEVAALATDVLSTFDFQKHIGVQKGEFSGAEAGKFLSGLIVDRGQFGIIRQVGRLEAVGR